MSGYEWLFVLLSFFRVFCVLRGFLSSSITLSFYKVELR